MAGCYGNDPFDRYWEAQLDKYLEQFEDEDEDDEDDSDNEDLDYDYERLNDK